MAFKSLGLRDQLLKAIQEAGYTEPTPIQAAAIPHILEGHDLVGIAQTGTGKTAAFTLPLLSLMANSLDARPGSIQGLVLAPTRELVVQIADNVRGYAKHLPLRLVTIYGGVSERPQLQALRDRVPLIIATPGRLIDLMGRRVGDFSQLKYLVLDEADRMLDMGFIPAIREIISQVPPKRQTLFFSATFSREIEMLTKEFLYAPKLVQIGRRSNPAESVTQIMYEMDKAVKPAFLRHLLKDPAMNMVLVFTRTKHGADRLAQQMARDGITTATLHSNRSQAQRLRALKDFKDGVVRVLVATDIAARGIDVDGISHVINFDFPLHPEDYVHRIGRTGRAKAIGDAISFVSPDERSAVRSLERFIGRGIVRKSMEGFTPPPRSDFQEERRENGPRDRAPAGPRSGSRREGTPAGPAKPGDERRTGPRPPRGPRPAPEARTEHGGRDGYAAWEKFTGTNSHTPESAPARPTRRSQGPPRPYTPGPRPPRPPQPNGPAPTSGPRRQNTGANRPESNFTGPRASRPPRGERP